MFLAFDDTDSTLGMCTTYLTVELIRRTGLDLIGYPRLVRLNPNIGYKTRGNGAVAVQLGKGHGTRIHIGRVDGTDIFAYAEEKGQESADDSLDLMTGIVEEFAVLADEKTNPGIVASSKRMPEYLYWEAVSRELNLGSVEKIIAEHGGKTRKFKVGRGIIGAASAIAWRGAMKTYELLEYCYPNPGDIQGRIRIESAGFVDELYPETFNNIDRRNMHAAIFPSNRTPVVYGVRAATPDRLPEIETEIHGRFNIGGGNYLIYETNQGTDDHVLHDPDEVWEGGSFSVGGEILEVPRSIRGGHYFTSMKWRSGNMRLAAFEPTKEFRETFRKLRPGDMVNSTGSYSGGTLKLEKLTVTTVSRFFRRVPPECPSCGSGMKTQGKNDYRCRSCGKRSSTPEYREEKRDLSPGSYEVPVSARRHLSMPLKLEKMLSRENISGAVREK